MNYELLAAARAFLAALNHADDVTLNAAFQRLATEANESDLATRLEPKQGLCSSFMAEFARRGELEQRAEVEARSRRSA